MKNAGVYSERHGVLVTPADPLAAYQPVNLADPYYGFKDYLSNWMIIKVDEVGETVQFAFGISGYADYWTAKADLVYEDFDVAIKAAQQALPE